MSISSIIGITCMVCSEIEIRILSSPLSHTLGPISLSQACRTVSNNCDLAESIRPNHFIHSSNSSWYTKDRFVMYFPVESSIRRDFRGIAKPTLGAPSHFSPPISVVLSFNQDISNVKGQSAWRGAWRTRGNPLIAYQNRQSNPLLNRIPLFMVPMSCHV